MRLQGSKLAIKPLLLSLIEKLPRGKKYLRSLNNSIAPPKAN